MTKHPFMSLALLLSLTTTAQTTFAQEKQADEKQTVEAKHDHNNGHDHDDCGTELKTHGSFAIGIGHEGKKEFMDGRIIVQKATSDRLKIVMQLDVRPFLVKGAVKDELLESDELRNSIRQAIAMQIAMQMNIPIDHVKVPNALVDKAVNKFVDDHITNKAVTEATIRELYFEAAITGSNSGEGIRVLVGKADPVWSLNHALHNHGAHSHYYFGVSQPTVRLKMNVGNGTELYAQVSNDRHGAIEDAHGSDTTGFVKNLLARSDAELLSYKINSFEVGIVKPLANGDAGVTVISAGRRPKRDGSVQGLSDSKNYYVLMNYSINTRWIDIQSQGSLEGVGLSEEQRIKRLNLMLSKSVLNEKLTLSTQLFVKKYTGMPMMQPEDDMNSPAPTAEKQKLVSWMNGVNYRFWNSGKKSANISANVGRVKTNDMSDKHSEFGVGFRW